MGRQSVGAVLSVTALSVSLAWAGAASAQAAAQPAAAAAADAQTAQEAGADVGDIVVTAQRQSQSIQKVPISMTAVSAAAIENLNIRNIDKIATVTPGLVYETGYSFVQVFIRGVGDQTRASAWRRRSPPMSTALILSEAQGRSSISSTLPPSKFSRGLRERSMGATPRRARS